MRYGDISQHIKLTCNLFLFQCSGTWWRQIHPSPKLHPSQGAPDYWILHTPLLSCVLLKTFCGFHLNAHFENIQTSNTHTISIWLYNFLPIQDTILPVPDWLRDGLFGRTLLSFKGFGTWVYCFDNSYTLGAKGKTLQNPSANASWEIRYSLVANPHRWWKHHALYTEGKKTSRFKIGSKFDSFHHLRRVHIDGLA